MASQCCVREVSVYIALFPCAFLRMPHPSAETHHMHRLGRGAVHAAQQPGGALATL
jgi:hypothetical protein